MVDSALWDIGSWDNCYWDDDRPVKGSGRFVQRKTSPIFVTVDGHVILNVNPKKPTYILIA